MQGIRMEQDDIVVKGEIAYVGKWCKALEKELRRKEKTLAETPTLTTSVTGSQHDENEI
jgi:hypothetical protein